MVVSGGLTKATGFIGKMQSVLANVDLPIKVAEIRKAGDPMTAVANGCLLAAQL